MGQAWPGPALSCPSTSLQGGAGGLSPAVPSSAQCRPETSDKKSDSVILSQCYQFVQKTVRLGCSQAGSAQHLSHQPWIWQRASKLDTHFLNARDHAPRHPSTVTGPCCSVPAVVGSKALPPMLLLPISPTVLLFQVLSPAMLSAPVRKNETLKGF